MLVLWAGGEEGGGGAHEEGRGVGVVFIQPNNELKRKNKTK